jgi:pterin-4a-carbinolamine dehydratase
MTVKTEISRLLDAYPNFTPRNAKGTIDTYVMHLSDIPEWLLSQAVDEHIKTSKFFPSVAELRDLAKRLANTADIEHAHPAVEIPTWSVDVYWQAMSLMNDSLAGEITEAELRRNVNWIAYERRLVEMA